tara:strand:- start:92 stop:643 length:552 start_codon:yes stop_codon:yes gene_type:complete
MSKKGINFFNNYFKLFNTSLQLVNLNDLIKISKIILDIKKKNKKILIFGNGASASIASHVSVDLTKAANIRSMNFNEANLITCLANDYGHENWMARAIEFYGDKGDLIIFVSSSGKSKNVVRAAKYSRLMKYKVITLTGFSETNPLKKLGFINLWVNSKSYNIIENIHQTWLLSIIDYIIANK